MIGKTKTRILAVFIAVFAADFSLAQSYTISPNDTMLVNGNMEDLRNLIIQQVNNSSDTLYLEWEKVSVELPAAWLASICDNRFCYTNLADTGWMEPIYPSDYGFLKISITPYVNYGTSVIRYAVWDSRFPNLKDTLTYILTVETVATETLNLQQTPSLWFSQNQVHVANNNGHFDQICLLDLNGRQVFNAAINGQYSFDLPHLPAGIYIAQLLSPADLQTRFSLKLVVMP